MSAELQCNGQAMVIDGAIVIRVPVESLPQVVEGAWALGALEQRWKVTNPAVFAEALCEALNHEDEQGTTVIHKTFDWAITEAIEQGAEGIEEHEEQDA